MTNVYTVIVDEEGNDKWLKDGIFCDKPKINSKNKNLLEIIGEEVIKTAGLDKTDKVLKLVTAPDYHGNIMHIGYLNKFNELKIKAAIVSELF
jgi:hypothetical protein